MVFVFKKYIVEESVSHQPQAHKHWYDILVGNYFILSSQVLSFSSLNKRQ